MRTAKDDRGQGTSESERGEIILYDPLRILASRGLSIKIDTSRDIHTRIHMMYIILYNQTLT